MDQFIVWLVSFMILYAPPGRRAYVQEAEETKDEAVARYNSIAADIAHTVWAQKPLFRGPEGRFKTSSVILAVMYHESSFRKDVDRGIGKLAKGDNGKSACLMQLNVGKGRTIKWNVEEDRLPRWGDNPEAIHQGFTAEELLASRSNCVLAGLRTVRVSFGSCSKLSPLEWLRAYASGNCQEGSKESRVRMGTALRWYSTHRPTFTEEDITSSPPVEEPSFGGPSLLPTPPRPPFIALAR